MLIEDNIDAPYVANLEIMTKQNTNFRATVWTGKYLQMTVMSIDIEGEVGLEIHEDADQFLRVEQGSCKILMGDAENNLDFTEDAKEDFAIFIPAGKWHNIINNGNVELKLYSIYAPPHHLKGTIHRTYEDAIEAEKLEQTE